MNIKQALIKAQKQFKKNKISSAGLDAEILLLHSINSEQETRNKEQRIKNKEQRTKRMRYIDVSPSKRKEKFSQKNTFDKSWLCARPEYELNKSRQKKFESFIKRRMKGEPIAYIISRKEFFGLDFYVDKRVMIPRPETEIIVEEIIKRFRHEVSSWTLRVGSACIIDIGTGSGCIAIALAKNIDNIKFYAIDISKGAIEVAKINAEKNKIFSRIKFLKGNLLEPIQKLKIKNRPTIIIANLPYLKTKDIKKNIGLTYEPISALNGGENGLEKIKELIIQIKKINFNIFECWLEINPEQANTLIRFIKKNLNGIKIEIVKDLSGQNRFLKISKN